MEANDIEALMMDVWEKTNNDNPDYILIGDEWKLAIAYYDKWFVRLFSPAGLSMLFPALSKV